ncbi:MAG: molecular chaperone DnaK, partial [Candidatus Binatia bacterium]
NMGKILGIDLGTTNSAMAVWDGHAPKLIYTEQRKSLLPSVVGFGVGDEVFVGETARCQAATNPERTIFSAKRFIGRKYKSVTADRKAVPYPVVAGKNGEALFLIDEKEWGPEEISAFVLHEMKRVAEASLGEEITGAVITVPAYFNDTQRAATKEAGRLAGLDVLRIVNEPTAAALAYGLGKIEDRAATVAVYDFGGGTFDVSILSVGDDIVEVIATHGDTHLGGDDMDARLTAWLHEKIEAAAGTSVSESPLAHQRVKEAAGRAKVALSTADTVEIELDFLVAETGSPFHFHTSLTRAALEEMIAELVDRSLASCAKVLEDARKQPDQIDEVVLVGGASRIPLVHRKVAEFFGKEPRGQVNPEEVVALGAAVQAGILSGELKGVILVDVTSLSLGIENHEGRSVIVIPRNTPIPVEETRIFTTSGDGQTSLQFHVVQGESESAEANESLGRFQLDGLRDAPAGTSPIEVTFAIDINGMVQVKARDKDTGAAQTVAISVITALVPEAAKDDPPPSAAKDAKSASAAVKLSPGASGADAPAKASAKSPASPAEATLRAAEHLLQIPGRKMTGVDRAGLIKRSDQLRALLSGPASEEELETAEIAVAKIIAKVKDYKPPRPRME